MVAVVAVAAGAAVAVAAGTMRTPTACMLVSMEVAARAGTVTTTGAAAGAAPRTVTGTTAAAGIEDHLSDPAVFSAGVLSDATVAAYSA